MYNIQSSWVAHLSFNPPVFLTMGTEPYLMAIICVNKRIKSRLIVETIIQFIWSTTEIMILLQGYKDQLVKNDTWVRPHGSNIDGIINMSEAA